jgi:hypothetical protein
MNISTDKKNTTEKETVKMTYIRNADGEFVCPDCGITKARQNTMFYHMKKHAGDARHVCQEPGCGKAFIQKSGLQQHMMQTHPDEDAAPSWSCPVEDCDHVCRMKANLIIHIGRKHGEGWIPALSDTGSCTGCKKSFASPTAYYYHAVQCFNAPEAIAEALSLNTVA